MTELQHFISIIRDFTKDLTETFPEYAFLWKKWTAEDLSIEDQKGLFQYCIKRYPERFFDILYQNQDIFDKESNFNMCFLPNVDFRLLFLCQGISDTTKKTLWKYLQLILFSIVGDVKDKSIFGDTMNLFEGLDEGTLKDKLEETMGGITDFFKNLEKDTKEEGGQEEEQESKSSRPFDDFENMFKNMNIPPPTMNGSDSEADTEVGGPDMKKIFEHLKGLFDGKIGSLAKEMAEEISGDFVDLVDEDMKNATDPKDIIQKLMKNPKKVMDLMKKVSTKLDTKLQNGEISKEELMKEAGDIFSKMKDAGGMDQFKDMFEKMKRGMGCAGKNMHMDTSKLNAMMKQNGLREQMKKKLERNKLEKMEKIENQMNYSLENAQKNPNEKIFRIIGEESQEKTFIHPDILKEMELEEAKSGKEAKGGKKADKKKKSKK
jgi:hypothetical protein